MYPQVAMVGCKQTTKLQHWILLIVLFRKKGTMVNWVHCTVGCDILLPTFYIIGRYQIPIIYDSNTPTSPNTLITEFSDDQVILYQFIMIIWPTPSLNLHNHILSSSCQVWYKNSTSQFYANRLKFSHTIFTV